MTDHPMKLEQGDDEEFVNFLSRQADEWCNNPPPAPDGFELVPCSHTPRHWPMYTVTDSDFYEPYCQEDEGPRLRRRIAQLEHKGHHFRGKFWLTIARWGYALGIVSSTGRQWSEFCRGCCIVRFHGRRPYILGLSRQQWACLRHGHRYRPLINCGLCAICLPCPTCGSTADDHNSLTCEAS